MGQPRRAPRNLPDTLLFGTDRETFQFSCGQHLLPHEHIPDRVVLHLSVSDDPQVPRDTERWSRKN